jgi:hypothetical protein
MLHNYIPYTESKTKLNQKIHSGFTWLSSGKAGVKIQQIPRTPVIFPLNYNNNAYLYCALI